MRKTFAFFSVALAVLVFGVVAKPVFFLWGVWQRDLAAGLEEPAVGVNDWSRLNANESREVIAAAGDSAALVEQLGELVRRAGKEGRRISISGARHSMGGHTLYPGGIVLDMRSFCGMELDEKERLLRVGSGACWAEVIPFLDERGWAVAVMQSNNDFTVGGSISVNCHGWQHDRPPMASTVASLRLLRADGTVVRCSRTENAELFSLVLGGYGLFGVILEVDLKVVPNEWYRSEVHRLAPRDYARVYEELVRTEGERIGMAYGRVSVAPDSFLEEAAITLLIRQPPLDDRGEAPRRTMKRADPGLLPRLVFRGSVGSDYGKNLRWQLEKWLGQNGRQLLSRNQIMNIPSTWFSNRDPKQTEILHEYFIPPRQLATFLERARPVLLRHRPDLLNITVRKVEADRDTFLRYAPEARFGLVMLFCQGLDEASEKAMGDLTRELIHIALACEGTYYLPYRPHATAEQFAAGYPMGRAFFELKKQYDPAGIFENRFSRQYGHP